jgi:hypothetical protein
MGQAPGRLTAYCIDKPGHFAARAELGRIWRRLIGTSRP